jgi:4'-phosphopantetheinyl transferase
MRADAIDDLCWTAGPPTPGLKADEVHVRRISLDLGSDVLAARAETLSHDEWTRAQRFVFATDRRRFVAARGALRAVLGRYTEQAPERLRFGYGTQGKPYLADAGNLEFNLSHSAELAVLALARGRRVGVDLEYKRELQDLEALAQHTFAPGEWAALLSVPTESRHQRFFRCWTRKEAYLKARGDGLSFPLEAFEVSLDTEPRLITNRLEPNEPNRWDLRAFAPAPACEACVAVERGRDPVRYQWLVEDILPGPSCQRLVRQT